MVIEIHLDKPAPKIGDKRKRSTSKSDGMYVATYLYAYIYYVKCNPNLQKPNINSHYFKFIFLYHRIPCT